MHRPPRNSTPRFLFALIIAGSTSNARAADGDGHAFFEKRIRPILVSRCLSCHSIESGKTKGGLRLDDAEALRKGGDRGATIDLRVPEKSLLITAVAYADPDLRMPPKGKLPLEEIALLKQWVAMGAPDPRTGTPPVERPKTIDLEAGRRHWAFIRPTDPKPPEVADRSRPWTPLDRFVVAALEAKGLRPVRPADKAKLLRRATLDMTGLPPTPEAVAEFLTDERPDAFARVVDRLLASPQYGERWGRHWLDVARYADSNGLDENVAHGNAWRYRDYVVAAFNRDKPFDRFIREQVAGDLLKTTHSAERDGLLIATGFLALGPKVLAEVDETKMEMDIVDEQIDTTGRAFLGLTLGCARCHDHKFDPVAAADYYALAGIFRSTKTMESFKKVAKWHENSLNGSKENPAATAMGVVEGRIQEARVLLRGNPTSPGELVPRRVPRVLDDGSSPRFPAETSGRAELADWISSPRNPLTARVIVNRLWRWHFGRGLVASPDNFGKLGAAPSHPELLDWLATRFLESGWSLKAMHRLILNSEVYKLASCFDEKAAAVDPEDALLWRFRPRRLEAEAIRDAVLFLSGDLDQRIGGSLLNVKNRDYFFDHTSKDKTSYDTFRRSIYLPVVRNHLYDGFDLFDYSDAGVSNGDRASTTVAPQALYLMNAPWIVEAADRLAGRVVRETSEESGRIRRLVAACFAREPDEKEFAALRNFVRESGGDRNAWRDLAQTLLMSNEVLYLD